MGIEDPDADVAEQLHPVDDPDADGEDDAAGPGELPPEADPADVADQRRAVPQDADER